MCTLFFYNVRHFFSFQMLEELEIETLVSVATDEVILPVKQTITDLSHDVKSFNFELLGLIEELRDRAAALDPDTLCRHERELNSEEWYQQMGRPTPKSGLKKEAEPTSRSIGAHSFDNTAVPGNGKKDAEGEWYNKM